MRSSRNRLERKPAEAYCLFRICLNPMIIFFNLSVCAGARIDSNIYLGYSTVVTVAARQKSRRAQHFNNACRRKLLNGIVYLPFCLRGRAIRIHTRDVAVVGTVGRLAWARGLDQPWPGPRPGWPDQTGLCEAAALHGALASLQWARDNGYVWRNFYTCNAAARGGHLTVLQWLRDNGCAWSAATCTEAARGGHLEVLRWARVNGCDWYMDTCNVATAGGHLEMLQWSRANGCD